MRGSIRGQTLHILNTSGIKCIGQSKFSAKDSARVALKAEGRGATSTALSEKTGIHSEATKNNYLDKWQEIGRFAKEEFGLKDMEKLTGNQVREFLAYKIEIGVSYSHWSGYAAALGKLENALNAYSARFDRGTAYDFRAAVNALRADARAELPRFSGTRDYENPAKLSAAILKADHRLVSRIQLESGLRIAGATAISVSQLKGVANDALTGKPVGLIDYVGKGGKLGTAQVSPATYQRLAEHITRHGQLKVSADGYRQSLKAAAVSSEQTYNGSHGLRWNFAQERFKELQGCKVGYEKSLGVVSSEMGHNRIEITEHYLGLK
jgi:hypothetical protein